MNYSGYAASDVCLDQKVLSVGKVNWIAIYAIENYERESLMQRLTTTIKREFLDQIIAGEKTSEFRENKDYWEKRLSKLTVPFELNLRNGYAARVAEVTVLINKVKKYTRSTKFYDNGHYELLIAKIIKVTNWKNPSTKTAN